MKKSKYFSINGARTGHIWGKTTYSYPTPDTKNQFETNYLNIKAKTKATRKTKIGVS